ncbi:MAG: hypothetical protein ACRCZF_17325 [Gemmataceae bacterium]
MGRQIAQAVGASFLVALILACGGANPDVARQPPPGFGADSPDDLATRWRQAHAARDTKALAKLNLTAAILPDWAGGGQWSAGEGTPLWNLLGLQMEDARIDRPTAIEGQERWGITWMRQSPPPGSYPTLGTVAFGEARLILIGRHPAWDGRIEVDAGLAVCCKVNRWYVQPEALTLPEVAESLAAGQPPACRPLPQGLTFQEEQSLIGKVTWAVANERLTALGVQHNQPTRCIRPAGR